ncbi:MAG: hypothetical protein WCO56_09020, partial [Verrucomicrobiota bacterium]
MQLPNPAAAVFAATRKPRKRAGDFSRRGQMPRGGCLAANPACLETFSDAKKSFPAAKESFSDARKP